MIRSILILTVLLPSLGFALDLDQHDIDSTDVIQPDATAAEYWGLNQTQWQRYQQYMETEGRYFYKDLDPVFVSGLIAKTEVERKQLAELYYRQELRRTAQLLAFNDSYRDAGKRLRNGAPIVDLASLSKLYDRDLSLWRQSTDLMQPRVGDRLTSFIDQDCGERCKNAFRANLSRIGGDLPVGIGIDLYFIGFTHDQINRWASSVELLPKTVKDGVVTLNFDDRYEVFNRPTLPTYFLVRDDKVLGQL